MSALHHLNALKALEASVRLGSFRAAAAELGVTPAAAGQQVRKLEEALGQALLIRRANGFEPTKTVALAAGKLTSGFDQLREALAIMSRDQEPNRVFVTVTPTIGERWLAPRLSGFLAKHPVCDLRIDSTPYVHYQSSPDFDFAIRYDQPNKSGCDETALFGETLVPVCRPEIAKQLGPIERDDCLLRAPLIHVDRSTDDPDWLHWDEWGQKYGYKIPENPQRMHFTFTTMALRAAYDGHGLHLAQLSITLPDLLSGRLVAPFGSSKSVRPSYPYSLIKINAGRGTPLLRAFQDWVVDEGKKTQAAMTRFLAAQGHAVNGD